MNKNISLPDYERKIVDSCISEGRKVYIAEYHGDLYTYYKFPAEDKRLCFIITPKTAPANRDK